MRPRIRAIIDSPLSVSLRLILSGLISKFSFLLPDKHLAVDYRGGKIYLNIKETSMFIDILLGAYEYLKTVKISELVTEGMTVVDVGAHKGYYSFLFADLMHERGRVIAFEPDPDNCHWFEKSMEVNGSECIELHRVALSDVDGSTTFYPGRKSGWGSFVHGDGEPAADAMTVKTRTLDSLLSEEGVGDVDIIKVDVEGAELLVLEGMRDLLRRSAEIKLFLDIDVKSSEEKDRICELLKGFGFTIYKIGNELEPLDRIDESVKDIYATKS